MEIVCFLGSLNYVTTVHPCALVKPDGVNNGVIHLIWMLGS